MLYRWPQGRVIRTIAVVLAVIIAGDMAYNGSYAGFAAYQETQDTRNLATGILFGVLALTAFVGGIAAVGFMSKTAQFLIEVEAEMAKVTLPKRQDVVRSTIIIAIMTVILAVLIWIVDEINYAWVHGWLLQIGE